MSEFKTGDVVQYVGDGGGELVSVPRGTVGIVGRDIGGAGLPDDAPDDGRLVSFDASFSDNELVEPEMDAIVAVVASVELEAATLPEDAPQWMEEAVS